MEALFTRGHNGGYGPNFQQENAPPDTGIVRRSAGHIMADTGLLKRMGAAVMLTTYPVFIGTNPYDTDKNGIQTNHNVPPYPAKRMAGAYPDARQAIVNGTTH